jgi:LmbE family N-acetylglucosaminyl deacetylase
MSHPIYTPKRAMVIMAHPDDIEFGCAGSIARWVRAGAEVCYVLITSGDVGIADPQLSREQVMAIREAEQTAAARHIGVNEVVYLREPDGMLENTIALRKKLVREIRRFRPEVVVCGDPTQLWVGATYINHPDHRAAGFAAIDAVVPAAGQPHLFEDLTAEGLMAHKVRKLYAMWWDESRADVYINISDTIDLKIEALRKHVSQMGDWDPADMIRLWASESAKGKEMNYAEGFRVVTLVSDADWEKMQIS